MSDVNDWLARSAAWRFAAQLFREPHAARSNELQALVPVLPTTHRIVAASLVAETEDRNDGYFAVLGPGGCAATESAYDLAAMANRGPLIAEVSAFYEAFAYPARLTSDLAPDHIVTELDFLGYLALKIAYAAYDERGEERTVAESAYADFRDRHLGFWLGTFSTRLREIGALPFARAADWVSETFASEASAQGGSR